MRILLLVTPALISLRLLQPIKMAGITIVTADNLLVRVECTDGHVGLGDAALGPDDDRRVCRKAVSWRRCSSCGRSWKGSEIEDIAGAARGCRSARRTATAARKSAIVHGPVRSGRQAARAARLRASRRRRQEGYPACSGRRAPTLSRCRPRGRQAQGRGGVRRIQGQGRHRDRRGRSGASRRHQGRARARRSPIGRCQSGLHPRARLLGIRRRGGRGRGRLRRAAGGRARPGWHGPASPPPLDGADRRG